MRTRTGDAKTTARIVLEGLQGKPGAEMCTEHQLSPSQDHQRREQWPANAPKALERQQHTRQEARLEQANTRLPNKARWGTHPRVQQQRRADGLARQRSRRVLQRAADLLPRMQARKADHPCRGYRRSRAYRRCGARLPGQKNRMRRSMRAQHLLVTPHRRLSARRTPPGSQPKPTRPNAGWGLDMTKVLGAGVGWGSIIGGRDGYPRKVVGSAADMRGTTRHGLVAPDRAVNRPWPAGVRGHALARRCDHGGQPTAVAFMEAGRT